MGERTGQTRRCKFNDANVIGGNLVGVRYRSGFTIMRTLVLELMDFDLFV